MKKVLFLFLLISPLAFVLPAKSSAFRFWDFAKPLAFRFWDFAKPLTEDLTAVLIPLAPPLATLSPPLIALNTPLDPMLKQNEFYQNRVNKASQALKQSLTVFIFHFLM